MNTMDTVFFGMDLMTVALFLLILIFSIGIVWRVEKELDWSYKFFVVAAMSIMLADVLGLYSVDQGSWVVFFGKGLRFIGALMFLVSILLMRDIVRKLDHEKK